MRHFLLIALLILTVFEYAHAQWGYGGYYPSYGGYGGYGGGYGGYGWGMSPWAWRRRMMMRYMMMHDPYMWGK